MRALGLEHVDALLLHECAPEHVTDEIVDLLHILQREGKIGFLGLATPAVYARRICDAWPRTFALVQSAYLEHEPPISEHARHIVHSVFAQTLQGMRQAGEERSPEAALTRALGSADVVLFSSSNLEHIRQNALLARPRSAVITPVRKSSSRSPPKRCGKERAGLRLSGAAAFGQAGCYGDLRAAV